jgi:hypothetical protein
MKRILVMVALLAVPGLCDVRSARAQTGDANLFPASTWAFFELSDPVELIATIFDHPLREKIESLPPYQLAIKSPQYTQFLAGIEMVETQMQMSYREALETLLANRISIGVDGATDGGAIIIHGKDAAAMKLIHEKLRAFAKLSDKTQFGEYRGIKAFRIDETRFAVYEDRLVITNKSELGKQVIDRLLDGGASLADNERFQTAWQQRDGDLAGWGFVDVEVVRQSGQADKVLNTQVDNPVAELLVGGIQSTLQKTPFLTVALTANTNTLGFQVGMPHSGGWIPEAREYFFGPSGNGRGPALPRTSQTLFTLSTYRDFSQMWLRAGDLFGADINDGFAKADANLTTLFAGRDFGEDILGSLEPEVGFIATRQDFANRLPRPTIKLPAFAFVFELREPETMTRELRRIFQSLIGFLNIVGAMNGQNQLELGMEQLGDDVQLVTSSYVPEEDDRDSTDAHIVYNFSPTVGFAGKRFVISSSAVLARQLTLAKTPSPATITDNTHANLNAAVLRDVLADNREQLIAQNMLEEGHSREEAEAMIELLLQVVDYFQDASLRLAAGDERLEAEFKIQVQP